MKSAREFKLVECGGTPYEIGIQWGRACKENILNTTSNIIDTMVSFSNLSREQVISMGTEHLPYIEKFDPYLVEIMRGQADGTEVPFEEIVVLKCMTDFTAMAMSGIHTLCTSFAATGSATEGGKTLLGQNIDFVPGSTIDFLKIHHNDGLVQYVLCFNNWGDYTLSSAGFGICLNATFARDHEFTLPVSAYIPKVMRQKTIAGAVDMLKQVARGGGYYQLADDSARIYGIESTHDDVEVLHPGRDILLHSNHYITERFKARDTAAGVQPDSYDRLDTISDLFNQHYGHITPEMAMEILANHDHYPNSICRHIDETVPISSSTLASFIMVPAEGAIYIARGNPCENGFARYEF
ncbi:MAG TPA: C45 family peptidase [Syntrophomonadaceae bacterium]|nr:C45 family peptidase [Syntrophomonadaceae bacterium]